MTFSHMTFGHLLLLFGKPVFGPKPYGRLDR
jgi:hypothetical protein